MQKVGEAIKQRQKHAARQRIYDLLGRLRHGERVQITLHGCTYVAVPLDGGYVAAGVVLYVHRGRVAWGEAADEGVYVQARRRRKILNDAGRYVYTGKILGTGEIAPGHDRSGHPQGEGSP